MKDNKFLHCVVKKTTKKTFEINFQRQCSNWIDSQHFSEHFFSSEMKQVLLIFDELFKSKMDVQNVLVQTFEITHITFNSSFFIIQMSRFFTFPDLSLVNNLSFFWQLLSIFEIKLNWIDFSNNCKSLKKLLKQLSTDKNFSRILSLRKSSCINSLVKF